MDDTDERFAAHLDVTGMLCPMPVLRTRRKLDDLSPGDMLLVEASDPAVVQDMPAFCSMAGHTLVMARVEGEKYLFEIRKGDGEQA
ncbi:MULTISPECIES: sulfurtransferase TusA family protein [Kordiimonas]|jgi:tRNA 2-thiouridine synthesizing protein A|uniref:sulfurtransferase TusA family protein n=1 Tax=Kordiimonas TaxID=288021 RepID=UPI00257ADA2F|nr:sulfurtransferase TusA family protein [Kordiimonas sp. UBA4487]